MGGMGGMGEGMQEGMMGMLHEHGVTPGIMLRIAEPLGLSDAQVQQLQSIQSRARADHDQHMAASTAAEGHASELMAAEPMDMDAYQAALQEAATHHVMAQVAMTRSSVDARAVLTPQQRTTLDTSIAIMHLMSPGQGMMGGAGGMGGMAGHGRWRQLSHTRPISTRHTSGPSSRYVQVKCPSSSAWN